MIREEVSSRPRLDGALSTESLTRALGTLLGERHTGVLHLSRGADTLALRFLDGHVVSGTQGSSSSGRLGEILVRCGRLDRSDLDQTLEKAALEGRRLGPVLVEERLVSREAVQDALRLQVRDVLFAALFWGSGTYRFEPDSGPSADDEISLEISTTALIFEMVAALESPGTVLRGLIDLATAVAIAPGAWDRLKGDRAPLTSAGAYVLSTANGVLSVAEIVAKASLATTEVERSLVALLSSRVLLPASRPASDPDETVALPKAQGSQMRERLIALRKQDLEETLASLAGKSHVEVLGLAPTASDEEIKDAFSRLAREYHPDAVRHPDLVEVNKNLFLLISEAYRVLVSTDSRRRPQEALTFRDRPRPVTPPEVLPSPAPREVERLPEGRAALSQAERLLAAGQPFEAVALLENMLPHLKGQVRSSARLLRARAYLTTPSGARPAETELRDLLQDDPGCLEACLMLGHLYRERGLSRRAAKEFSRALEIDPRHPEAVRELQTSRRGSSRIFPFKLALASH